MTGWLDDGVTTWAARPVARTLAAAEPRSRIHIRGVVVAVRSRPFGTANGPLAGVSHGAVVEATLDDGTATVLLRWMGRTEIPGMAPGALVEIEGTVALVWGERVVLNPLYRFAAGPALDEPYSSSS